MKIKVTLLIVLIVILSIQNIFLSISNRDLKRENNKLRFILYTPSDALQKGQNNSIIPNFELKDINNGGQTNLIDKVEKEKLILFVFSTDCYACDMISEQWNEICDRLDATYSIVGISKDDPRAIEGYSLKNKIKFQVFQYKKIAAYDYFGTLPRTIIIDRTGKILMSVSGISNDLKNKIKE